MPHVPLTLCFISDSGGQDYVETVIPSNRLPSAAFFSETQRQFSRYFIEFEELQLLGKGAFGAVIKVWYRVIPPTPFRAPSLFHFHKDSWTWLLFWEWGGKWIWMFDTMLIVTFLELKVLFKLCWTQLRMSHSFLASCGALTWNTHDYNSTSSGIKTSTERTFLCALVQKENCSFFLLFGVRVAVDKKVLRLKERWTSNWEMAPAGLDGFYFPAIIGTGK